jgi:type III pantothenate kinase
VPNAVDPLLDSSTEPLWLGLNIGNSRHHWAAFRGQQLQLTWDVPNLEMKAWLASVHFPQAFTSLPGWPGIPCLEDASAPGLWLASVVPDWIADWQGFPQVHSITLEQIPLSHTYPSLGIDRALALWGAGITYGFPVLVIDAGTALTLTGGNRDQEFCGGAILPGLGLQHRILAGNTAALPELKQPADFNDLPQRWGRDTTSAICSGILYNLLAGVESFIEDWQQLHPTSPILFTGGDGQYLCLALNRYRESRLHPLDLSPAGISQIKFDPNLVFTGIADLKAKIAP